jgi:probable HAF family extracellular repeat protein
VLSADLKTFQNIDVPGSVPGTTAAYGINNLGQIVGSYTATTGGVHGFVLSSDLQTYKVFDVSGIIPGALAGTTLAYGINDAGEVVGTYTDTAGSVHGFVLSAGRTSYATIDAPRGYGTTSARGINDDGWVVGAYDDASGRHGFEMSGSLTLTSVPTPTSTPTTTPTTAPPPVTVTSVRAVTNKSNQITQVVVTFSGAVNPAEADSRATYRLAMPGKGGSYTARNAKTIRLKRARYDAATNRVTLVPRTPFKITKRLEISVAGMPPAGF